MDNSENLDFKMELHLRATPEAVWQALVDPEQVKCYYLCPLREINLGKGGKIIYGTDDEVMISGDILDFHENSLLVHTFRFGPERHSGTEGDPDTVVTFEIGKGKDRDDALLKLTHSGFAEDNQTLANIRGGWPVILERLKNYLELDKAE